MQKKSFHAILKEKLNPSVVTPSMQPSTNSTTDPQWDDLFFKLYQKQALPQRDSLNLRRGIHTYIQGIPSLKEPLSPDSESPVKCPPHLTHSQNEALVFLQALGVHFLHADFTRQDLRKALRILAHRYHPDRHQTKPVALQEFMTEKFNKIKAAVENLELALSTPEL